MPVVGKRTQTNDTRSWSASPMKRFAQSYLEAMNSIVQEGADIVESPASAMRRASAVATLKDFFMEGACDHAEYEKLSNPEGYEQFQEDTEALFTNDCEAIQEYAAMSGMNPVIGLSFPIHKYIMMNSVFGNCLPRDVAAAPKFTLSIESRVLVTPEGTEIDYFTQQNQLTSAIELSNPVKTSTQNLPLLDTVNLLSTVFSSTSTYDNLSIESYVSAVNVKAMLRVGDIDPSTGIALTSADTTKVDTLYTYTIKANGHFAPNYGEYDRTIFYPVKWLTRTRTGAGSDVDPYVYSSLTEKTVILSGYMKNNRMNITSSDLTNVPAITLSLRLDPSSAMIETCSVKWKVRTDIFEIPNATPINVPISPEEVKDLGALYQVNQLTKVMSLIKDVLINRKDDLIKADLDNSFTRLPTTQKFAATFDFAPPDRYYSDPIEWRNKMFMDTLDTYVTQAIQVWNDPNMVITVIGRADLIRKVSPTDYTYQTPTAIGPVELDFTKTVVTSDKRVYQFVSSDKMRDNNNLIVVLSPRNSERVMYKIFDYQSYVSNEIRNSANPALPAIHAFERFKFLEYQPVQGRVKILNAKGLRTDTANTDPIGTSAMNDFTANAPLASGGNTN